MCLWLGVTHLVLVQVSPTEVLAVDDAPGPRRLKLLQPLDGRDKRHGVMPARDDHRVKRLRPPVIPLLPFPAQRQPPLPAELLRPLDGRAVRDEVLVAVAPDQVRDVLPQDVPVPEGRRRAVQRRGAFCGRGGDGLLGEAHGGVVHVCLQVGVDGGLGEARLAGLGRVGGEALGDGERGISCPGCQLGEVGDGRRTLIVTDPEAVSLTVSADKMNWAILTSSLRDLHGAQTPGSHQTSSPERARQLRWTQPGQAQ